MAPSGMLRSLWFYWLGNPSTDKVSHRGILLETFQQFTTETVILTKFALGYTVHFIALFFPASVKKYLDVYVQG